jgi:hypothetical protein
MEQTLLVLGKGIRQEIIGESLEDCLGVAYRLYQGQRVQVFSLTAIGYIDGQELYVDPQYLRKQTIKEIMELGT